MDAKSETQSDSKSQVGRSDTAADSVDAAGHTLAAAAEPRAIPGTPIFAVAGSVAGSVAASTSSSCLSSVRSSALSGVLESPVLTSVEVKVSRSAHGSPSPTPTPAAGFATAMSPAPPSPPVSGAAPLAAFEFKRASSQSTSEKASKASTPTSSALPTRRHPLPLTTRAPSETLDAMVVAVKEDKADHAELDAQRTPTALHSSPKSSIALKDEIVVDTKANSRLQSPSKDASLFEPDDLSMEDVSERSPTANTYPKRKRSSIYPELDEEKLERGMLGDDTDDMSTRSGRSSSRSRALAQTPIAQVQPQAVVPSQLPSQSQVPLQSHLQSQSQAPATSVKNIPLGYWRDSAVPDVKDRHAVIGFMDSRDRLRTRVQPTNRSGKNVAAEYPLPPGPGGSWVVFERIVFDRHLVGLDHNQVKEFVKIRSETLDLHESPEEAQAKDTAAVKEALRRAALHPTPDHLPAPQIAYGEDLPDYMVNANRPEKKRRVASGYGHMPLAPAELAPSPSPQLQHTHPQLGSNNLAAAGSPVASAIQRSVIDLLPGTRPTKILLGYWRGSSEDRMEDKHAVFGILGANDMFRVKVARETRDGRTVMGNFPTGAGALWIHYDEVEFEPHIRHLSRPEVKEYVRVRQRQLDEGERADERSDNEAKAVIEAQARVISAGGAAQSTLGTAGRVDTISFASAANLNRDLSRQLEGSPEGSYPPDGRSRREYQGHELRQTRRSYAPDARDNNSSSGASVALSTVAVAMPPVPSRAGRHALPDRASPELRPANRMLSSSQGGSTENGSGNLDRVERTNSLARREIARVETIQMRNEQRAANREAAMAMASSSRQMSAANGSGGTQSNGQYGGSSGRNGTTANGSASSVSNGNGVNANGSNNGGTGVHSNGTSSRIAFNENIGRLNKVWEAQEASRLRAGGAGGEDAKMYNGVKYERKQTGPFQGKLVSPGAILSIDGEDYVEYRVLTKPTFF